MADKKISQLSSASTPLAGTEVLPIVQSSTTVKVASNDLTVRNVRANATTGILQVTGPAAASTRVMTVPDANFTAARTDAAQSFTGDQTLTTGNLVVGTAAKGIDFSANTGAAGETGALLNWYEEGTWTPVITTGISDATMSSNTEGRYTRIGRVVFIHAYVETSSVAGFGGSAVLIKNLPFAPNSGYVGYAASCGGWAGGLNISAGQVVSFRPNASATNIAVLLWDDAAGTTDMTGTEWSDNGYVSFSLSYMI